MRVTIDLEGPPGPDDPHRPLWRRLLWFVALAAAGLAVTGTVAYGLKALLPG